MCDSPQLLEALGKIEKLLEGRPYTDQTCAVSDTQSSLILGYKGYKYLYLFSPTALSLKLAEIGTLAVSANAWTNISFRPGLKVFSSGQASSVLVVLRATDEQMEDSTQPISGTITANQGTNPWVTSVSNVNANGQATMANSSPVVIASDQSAFAVTSTPQTSNTSALTSVVGAAASTQLLAVNANRKGYRVYNDSSAILYLAESGAASTSSYTTQIPPQGLWESPTSPIWQGAVFGIWASATGNARITELT